MDTVCARYDAFVGYAAPSSLEPSRRATRRRRGRERVKNQTSIKIIQGCVDEGSGARTT